MKPKIPESIAEILNDYHPITRQLLYNRGITDKKTAKEFLETKYEEGLNSPFLFFDMEKAVKRVWQAIESREKIVIYGDYDADAVTANAVLRQTFKFLGHQNIESYIPDRFTEGYGVNLEAIEKIIGSGAKLIITVDCGTNSVEAADVCKTKGVDLIITDHHEIVGEIPESFALINPKNPNDNYPYRDLTGVGVAFKMAQAILRNPKSKIQNPKFIEGYEKWLLDLVAIGTVADCHSLLGENRILVKYGLKVLTKSKWIGLRVLCQKAGLDFKKNIPDAYTLGFVIAPRLNAAGRLEHANIALNLLLEEDLSKAREKAAALDLINQKRQNLTQNILSQAREHAEIIRDRKILALLGEGWPKGIVGLVAGKIAEEFSRPTIVLEKGEIHSTGSARTNGEFDIMEALKSVSEHLVKFGGHKQAAGLTIETKKFELFYSRLLEYAEKNLNSEALQKVLELDAEIAENDLRLEIYELFTDFEPFGTDNPKPKFLIQNLDIVSLRLIGITQRHLQLQLKIGNRAISAIMFNVANFAKNLQVGNNIGAVCEIIRDDWNGSSNIKLKIIDFKIL
ncbi:MAG: single-stranded-DNA-specific exonuclease RecJ [Candidatus Doudnabacteria bacterium]|nr:single-stranded-DNA-specific exonuclease RecJ [Candidatus Doudnabacteria bacterium]